MTKRGPAGNETFLRVCLGVQRRIAETYAAMDAERDTMPVNHLLSLQRHLARDHQSMVELREWWSEGPPVD